MNIEDMDLGHGMAAWKVRHGNELPAAVVDAAAVPLFLLVPLNDMPVGQNSVPQLVPKNDLTRHLWWDVQITIFGWLAASDDL